MNKTNCSNQEDYIDANYFVHSQNQEPVRPIENFHGSFTLAGLA
jgi:hypothetical protein